MKLQRVKSSDFISKTKHYLKPSKFILTFRDKDKFLITIETANSGLKLQSQDEITTLKLETQPETAISTEPIEKVYPPEHLIDNSKKIEKVVSEVKNIATAEGRFAHKFVPNWQRNTSKYGCGCLKTDDTLCKVHGRL